MSEQNVISFSKKKNDRRRLLKEFYKLQESNKRELENLHNGDGSTEETLTVRKKNDDTKIARDEQEEAESEAIQELTLQNFDEFVKSKDFKTLIAKENAITDELNSNQSEIKSIIYNNYYELIKINNYLENLKNGAAGSESSRKKQLNTLVAEEEDDNTEFTIGVDDEDLEQQQDNTLKILHTIKENISAIKASDLRI